MNEQSPATRTHARNEININDDGGVDGRQAPGSQKSAETGHDRVDHADDDVGGADRTRRLRLPSSRRGKLIVAAAVALVLAATVAPIVWLRATSLPDNAAFAYGDRVVSQNELDARVQTLRALYGVVPPTDPAKLDGFRRDVAKSVAVSMILDNAAGQRHIVVADKQARDLLDQYIAAQFGPGGHDAFIQALGNVGTSEQAVLDEIKRQLTVGRLMDQIVGPVTISDAELHSEFSKRREQLGTPERRVVRNIVVGSQQEAQGVLNDLRTGAPIEIEAAAHNLDGSTKQTGGLLGQLTRQQLEGPVADAVFATQPSGTYGPVQGRYGWNVGRVDQVLPPVPAQFDQVKDSFRQTLQTEESLRRWRAWLEDQIRAAQVEYAPQYRPADPDAPPNVQGSSGASQPPG